MSYENNRPPDIVKEFFCQRHLVLFVPINPEVLSNHNISEPLFRQKFEPVPYLIGNIVNINA